MIEPDIGPVWKVYAQNETLVDRMKEFEKKDLWSIFSNDFVLNVSETDMVGTFVRDVYQAKVKVERQMRRDLDQKIIGISEESHIALYLGR